MTASRLFALAFAVLAVADPAWGPSKTAPLNPAISQIFPQGSRLTPQILETFIEPNEVNLARNSYIYRDGTALRLLGDLWTASGANVYWLGLDENVIPPAGQPFYAPTNASYPTKGRVTEIMNILVTMGAKLIRSHTLAVSVGNPLSLSPKLGVYNPAAFEAIDWAVYQARQHGLRIMAPLIDNWDYYHGGKYTFLRWAGYNISGSDNPLPANTMLFYTDPKIVASFKDYIQHLLTHVNPYTGLTYAEDPTIFAYETGNEMTGINGDDLNVPASWTRDICQFVKQLGPQKLCIDGTSGINTTHFAINEVDIFTHHFYPVNTTTLKSDIAKVATSNRVYLAGEVNWMPQTGTPTAEGSLAEFYKIILARQSMPQPVAAGSLFWSLFGHNVPDCSVYVNHTDGVTMQYGNPANPANITKQISIIREHYFAMQNITVDSYLPAVGCNQNYIPGYDSQYTYGL